MVAACEAAVPSPGNGERGVFRDSDIAPRWNEVLGLLANKRRI
jgi:hypothetical protein